jgi:hypothetical protein
MSHDEGACYAPIDIWNSTMLSHWGRLERNHTSNTGYGPDNYDSDPVHYVLQPRGWAYRSSKAHACYDPEKVCGCGCGCGCGPGRGAAAGPPGRQHTFLGCDAAPQHAPPRRGAGVAAAGSLGGA